jgi:acetolactate synthase-1/2/3 large subunit
MNAKANTWSTAWTSGRTTPDKASEPPPSRRSMVVPAGTHSMVVPAGTHSMVVPAGTHSMMVPAGTAERVSALRPEPANFSSALVDVLVSLGVEYAFGLFGGAVAPFCQALNKSPIKLMHFRHEAGAAFAAIEASLASGKPVVVFATTGPGLTNTITGMAAARWEGAKVIFISGATPAAQRGRWAFQETSGYTALSGLFTAGPIFHHAALLESPLELETIASRFATGLARPGGFVAHLGLPIALQTAPMGAAPRRGASSVAPAGVDAATVEESIRLLTSDPFVIWVGHGARRAATVIRAFARRTGACVMSSPRGKGIFPEDDPQFLGVTGLGGHASVEAHMAAHPPGRVLVLGTRLGEFTSFWSPELVPPGGMIHVDLDPEAFGAAYPNAPTYGVQSDVRTFVEALLDAWPEDAPRPPPRLVRVPNVPEPKPRAEGPVRPSFLMQAVQRSIVEGSDATVITEAGNSFALGSHWLRFSTPRYRVSSGFGSMGHAVGGVLGNAIARRRKAVAIAGDGAMLMLNEMNTAVAYGVDAVWIVLNDARYGMIDQGMRSIGWEPFHTDFPRADFVAIARGMGADGIRVEHEADVEEALERALEARGPFVVDVIIDPTELAPSNKRNKSLVKQGVNGDRRQS